MPDQIKPLTLFNYSSRNAYESRDSSGTYMHTRGGSAVETWLKDSALKRPFDLLFTLDLADPAVDIQIPDVTRLPLLYGTNYLEYDGEQAYRVTGSETVEILNRKRLRPDTGEPFVEISEETAIQFEDLNLDLSKAENALNALQVFGLDDLSDSELDRALEIAYSDQSSLEVYEDWTVYEELTRKEYLEFWGAEPFWQPGGFSDTCDNPSCPSKPAPRSGWLPFSARNWLRTIFRPGDWQDTPSIEQKSTVRVIAMCQVDFMLVVFRYCSACHTIFTENQA